MGAAAWLWNQRGDSQSFRRVAAGGYRIALSGAAPVGKTEMDQGGMANLRKQAAGKVLSTDSNGKEAVEQRALEMVATFGCDRGCSAAWRKVTRQRIEVKEFRRKEAAEAADEILVA